LTRKTTYIRLVFLVSFLFQTAFLFSQNLKDTVHLSQFEVTANFALHNEGFKKVRMDSGILVQYLNTDLSTLLAQHSTIFVKSYGNGSLSTPSFRGTSANHTQVEWNGININSPMLGQMDLSQVPVSQFETLEILYGAATVARTSGAFGGIVNLVSNPAWDNKVNFTLAQTIASFSSYTTDAHLTIGNNTIQSITKFNYSNAINDFYYNNDYNHTREKLVNAMYILGGITQETFIRLSKKDVLSTRIWYSDNFHQLPPITATVDDVHKEEQYDRSIRSMLDWRRSEKNYYLTVRSSLVDQYMQFTERERTYNHHSYTWANLARLVYTGLGDFIIRPGVSYTSDWVISDSYNGLKTRRTLGMFSEFNYHVRKFLQLSVVLRQDMIDGKFLPFVPAFAVEYKPFNAINLTFSTNLCRNYRYPDLNELYFEIYGNPDLKPESDYAFEGGVVYNTGTRENHFFIETEFTGYYSKMVNYIQWQPKADGNYTPNNLSEVHSRGLESGLNISWSIAKFRLTLSNTYNYCVSTNERSTFPGDSSMGKQLIYTPIHTLNSSILINRNGFYGSYIFSLISERYTSPDNSSYMPGYYLSNIFLGKNFHLKKYTLSLQLNLNNLFDLDYQSIVDRPMPGRNYALTLKFNFRK
jgi:iron complex outermembrane receptor protein